MTHVTNSLKRELSLSPLLNLYRTHFPGELPPVLRGDAPDWVKSDFMRQALLRRGIKWGEPTTDENADTPQVLTQREASAIDAQNCSKADASRCVRTGLANVGTQRDASLSHSDAPDACSDASASYSDASNRSADVRTQRDASLQRDAPRSSSLTDPRLDNAPEAVKAARRKLRGLIPEASRLHMELVIAARGDNVIENDKLTRRRARLVAKLTEAMDERDSLWNVIDAYLEEVG